MKTTKEKQMSIKRVEIFDMDGTIVDSTHRYRTMPCGSKIDLAYWNDNAHKAMNDKMLPLAEHYKACLADPECYVIIATARVMGAADWAFVQDVLGMPDYFISRKAGDTISGGKLKINGLQKFFNLRNFQNAEFTFYEDNVSYLKAVCDRFNIRGVYIPSNQGH
jgi:phosphoglycolate phosphatase-like HAD superfamily hydrolase